MVISQPPGNKSFILLSCFTNAASIAWMLPETPYVLYMQLQHQGNSHRNGAIKHIFCRNCDPRRDHQQIVLLFILSLHALALHLAVKILLQIFCMKIWARWVLHGDSSVVFPSRMPAGPHFVTQPILLSENIPNIWHKSSTKHKECQTRLKR